jgi:hypothetical protein
MNGIINYIIILGTTQYIFRINQNETILFSLLNYRDNIIDSKKLLYYAIIEIALVFKFTR